MRKKAITVLIVHRQETVRRLMSVSLRLCGCEAATAMDGQEALRLAEDEHFDVAVAGVELPDMHGTELTRRLKESGISGVVLTSAYGRPPRGPEDRFLSEPFNLDEFLEAVGAAANRELRLARPRTRRAVSTAI